MIASLAYSGMGSGGSQIGISVGTGVITAAPLAGPAAPLVAAVGALIDLGATIAGALHIGEGCGQTCVQATSIVNSAEPTFKANVTAYEQGIIDQTTALSNFNAMWLAIQQACGGIPGAAGQNCVGDRQQGACKWKDSNGQCWNWWVGYHDPLTLPSQVPYDGGATSTTTTGSSGTTNTSVSPAATTTGFTLNLPLILGAGLIVAAVAMN